jgi:protoporphyrinogen oxidase
MHVVVLGAGLAGLAAAWELARGGARVTVLERERRVGGMAASWKVGPYWLDYGPHRFHSRDPELLGHVFDVLDHEVVVRQRRSRIHLRGRFFDYPLRLTNVLNNLPPTLIARAGLDYLAARARERLRPTPDASFEAWVVKRFGRTLYELFFGPYTTKAWGMPCDQISADWASQRIAQASLWDTVKKTVWPPSDGEVRGLVREFYYPARGGIGQIARRYATGLRGLGADLRLDTSLEAIEVAGGRARRVIARVDGEREEIDCDHVVNTVPWTTLLRSLRFTDEAGLSTEACEALGRLETIGIVFVYLEVARPSVMPDHWVYLPSPELAVHRVSEFKNFCDGAAPGDSTALCCEITCRPGDARWNLTPGEAETIARADLVRAGLLEPGEGRLLHLARLAQAYPVYDLGYRERVQALRRETRRVANLTTTGRQGLFRYNNMDHSIAMGRKAAAALLTRPEGPAAALPAERVAEGVEYFG